MIIFDIIVILIFLRIGFSFKNNFKIFDSYDRSLATKLFGYHLLLAIGFYLVVNIQGGDATNYWFLTYDFRFYDFDDVLALIKMGSATGNLLLINYIPAKVLGLSFLTGSIMYGTLGYMGFMLFYALIKENIPNIQDLRKVKIIGISIFPFLLFLPNIHFWSSGIGKDTILFFCIALFAYSLRNFKKRWIGVILSMVLSFLIRPHITLFLLVSFGIGYLLDGRLKGYQKVIVFILFMVGLASIFNYVLLFVKLENLEFETIEKFSSKSASNLSEGSGSGIDVSGYPYPVKIFTFIYRPLFIDAPGVLGLLASVENFFLLLLTGKILMNKPFKGLKTAGYQVKGLFIFLVLGAMAFSLILGNLGIMLRQKTPFIMALFIFGYWVISNNIKKSTVNETAPNIK